jgi:anaerobic glycerol-3-phosphate dehydrogenase
MLEITHGGAVRATWLEQARADLMKASRRSKTELLHGGVSTSARRPRAARH